MVRSFHDLLCRLWVAVLRIFVVVEYVQDDCGVGSTLVFLDHFFQLFLRRTVTLHDHSMLLLLTTGVFTCGIYSSYPLLMIFNGFLRGRQLHIALVQQADPLLVKLFPILETLVYSTNS